MPNDAPNAQRHGRLIVAMLVLFCACGLFGGVVGTYIHTFNRQLTEENSSRLAEVSDAIVTHLTTVITDTQTMLHAVARGIDALDSEKTASPICAMSRVSTPSPIWAMPERTACCTRPCPRNPWT